MTVIWDECHMCIYIYVIYAYIYIYIYIWTNLWHQNIRTLTMSLSLCFDYYVLLMSGKVFPLIYDL